MNFEITLGFHLCEQEINYIIDLIGNGLSTDKAVDALIENFSETDYYVAKIIKNDIIKSINERVEENDE